MSAGWRAVVGAAVWSVFVLWTVPNVHHGAWAEALILFAALVLMPLVIEIADGPARAHGARQLLGWAARLQLPGALILLIGFRLEPGVAAMASAGLWSAVLLTMAASGAVQLWKAPKAGPVRVCSEAGLVFAAIGAAWLLADRAGVRPLGFDGDIVLLTAVHFHYAGVILPVLTSRALEAVAPGVWGRVTAAGVVAGVPAVALGITSTQLGWAGGVECAAALIMSTAGLAVAMTHVRLGLGLRRSVAVRCLWVAAGCSLAAGMLLSALYGMREVFAPWPWLDIRWMRALHGSVNAIGFAGAGTWAWWSVARRSVGGRVV
jgi:hypothetical protein